VEVCPRCRPSGHFIPVPSLIKSDTWRSRSGLLPNATTEVGSDTPKPWWGGSSPRAPPRSRRLGHLYSDEVIFVAAVVIGLAFGGGDQYLGSLAWSPWAWAVSGLSAPWLLLPFGFGCTQTLPRRAALVGSVATASALVGYFAMTLSPVEGVHLGHSLGPILGLLRSNVRVILGGAITGPLYGYLGQRWHVRRAWLSAALVAGAVCLEPLAEKLAGRLPSPSVVWQVEIAVGLALAVLLAVEGVVRRRTLPRSG